MTTPKDIALAIVDELFIGKDLTAVERWIHPTYIQHNPAVPDGPEGIRNLFASAPAESRFELHRVIADGDLVALHNSLHGLGPTPLVAFDIFRIEDGTLAEHWDGMQPVTETTVSGRTVTDGPTAVVDLDKTDANRALVTAFVQNVLVGGKAEAITDYISAGQYHQHNPKIADGLDGLAAALEAFGEQGITMTYNTIHKVVAEGNFVLTLSEGELAGAHTAFFDLFRVHDGKIVEHWDVTPEIPSEMAHDNGMF